MQRLLTQARPYEEVAAALDAVASMPEAAEPAAAAQIALERHPAQPKQPGAEAELLRLLLVGRNRHD